MNIKGGAKEILSKNYTMDMNRILFDTRVEKKAFVEPPQRTEITVEEKWLAHSFEMTSKDDQIPLLPQTEKDVIEEGKVEEGKEVHHLIDIKDTNGQAPSMSQTKKSVNKIFAEKFKDLGNSSINSCTIFKVNVWLRESNKDAYTPKMVSIGPYHNKNPQLDPMEKYKLLYLQRFLQRKEGLDVESCISELEELKEEAIKCYGDIKDMDEFCQMLLLDGCFVVEFIRERCGLYPIREEEIININNGDYIFRDLMLLENQLPFVVLNKLHLLTKQDDELPLAMLANNWFTHFVALPKKTFRETEYCNAGNIKHLLHAGHIFLCHGQNPIKKSKDDMITWDMVMPNATELSEAGVSFAKVSDTTSLFDIKFENGLMTIPCFRVEDGTETFLRNLIAYEQQSVDVQPKYFSDFATFMDDLIKSDKDVNLLRQKGIIVNWIGEDKEVANLFNKIGIGINIVCSDFYYKEECIKACQHCEKGWNRMKANLIHNYFNSPWVGASTVAAIILLILTAIQTILTFTGPVK